MFENFAILFEGQDYSYHDYVKYKEKHPLTGNGLTMVLMARTPELLFTIFHLFEKKIPFILIDPDYPPARMKYVVQECRPSCIISDVPTELEVPDEDWNIWDEDLAGVAYILYTSGTTGNPKGVMVKRESIFYFMQGITEVIDFAKGKSIMCATSVSFDIFFMETLIPALIGMQIILAKKEEQQNPRKMKEFLEKYHPDMLQMTPSKMKMLLNYSESPEMFEGVQEIMLGGEAFPLSVLKFLQSNTKARIYNMYGPTEATIWSAISELTKKQSIDIGRPIEETRFYIMDEYGNEAAPGESGEICIAGKGLAKGYYKRPELTSAQFVSSALKKELIYRTGDIGRINEEEELELIGRTDNQIKIRGCRIEPEEIEYHVNQFTGIQQSLVFAEKRRGGGEYLKCYYLSSYYLEQKALKNYLYSVFPSYMVPDIFQKAEAFQYTLSGKLDRKSTYGLLCQQKESKGEQERLNSNLQHDIYNVICQSMEDEAIKLACDLESNALDSITLAKVVVNIENYFHCQLDYNEIASFKYESMRSLIEYMELRIMENNGGREVEF